MRRLPIACALLLWAGTVEAQTLGGQGIGYSSGASGSVAAGTAASLGSTLLANGDFATNDCTSWTCAAGWVATTGAAVHTPGDVGAISQSVTVVTGSLYQVVITQAGTPAGNLTFALGATTYPTMSAVDAANYPPALVAAANGAVTFSITPDTNYNGTLDDIAVKLVTVSVPATVAGYEMAPGNATGGATNVFLGANAGQLSHSGHGNVAVGYDSYTKSTSGSGNVVVGYNSLKESVTGYFNTILGAQSAGALTSGYGNNTQGYGSLQSMTTGYSNAAIGVGAMQNSTTAYKNVAIGSLAMGTGVTTGWQNVAVGEQAMLVATSSAQSVAIGGFSGKGLTTGNFNTAVGYGSLATSTIHTLNTCIGYYACNLLAAGSNTVVGGNAYSGAAAAGNYNTLIGGEAGYKSGATPATANTMTGASNNTFVGYEAGLGSTTQRTNATCIGYQCYADADNIVVLGDENVTSVLASADGGAIVTAGGFKVGANTGISGTVVVKGSDGSNCNLVFEGGIVTSETCP